MGGDQQLSLVKRISELEAWHEQFPTGEDYARMLEGFEVESWNWDGSGPLRSTMEAIAASQAFLFPEGEVISS